MSEPSQKQRKNKGHENIVPYKWKPGQSGNPGGRPKGISITAELRKELGTQKTYTIGKKTVRMLRMSRIVLKAIEKAEQGDFNFFRELLNRVDGKVAEQMILSGLTGLENLDDADVAHLVEIAKGKDPVESGPETNGAD